MSQLFKNTSVFDWNFQEWKSREHKIIVNSGGTYSSKTYSTLQLFFIIATSEPGAVISVVADTVPNLKTGAFRDFQRIISDPRCKRYVTKINLSDRIVYFTNGSMIEFNSYMNGLDAAGGRRQYLYINECNRVAFDIYVELSSRTEKQIWLDFNPTATFWAHENVKPLPECVWFRSWYIHNEQLAESKIKEIESWEHSPILFYRNRWKVMGLGLLGVVEGAVYDDWESIDTLPDNIKYRYVIDFGYNNDPLCLTKIGHEGINNYSKVLTYETGLTPVMIAKNLHDHGITNKDMIVADGGGGGNVIIAQLRNVDGSLSNIEGYPELKKGFNIFPAWKPPGSIEVGIGLVKQCRNFITKDSVAAWQEFHNYIRKKDPNGKFGEPIDASNHYCDTRRYYELSKGRHF